MVDLFVFRHGETEWNRLQRFQGHSDIPLNEVGKTQALALREFVKDLSLEAILSSDLKRAFSTAQIAIEGLDIPVFSTQELREIHLGEAEGLTKEETEIRFGSEFTTRWRQAHFSDLDMRFPEGESCRETIERLDRALRDFGSKNTYKRVGISTHGAILRRYLLRLSEGKFPQFGIPNCAVFHLRYLKDQDRIALVKEEILNTQSLGEALTYFR